MTIRHQHICSLKLQQIYANTSVATRITQHQSHVTSKKRDMLSHSDIPTHNTVHQHMSFNELHDHSRRMIADISRQHDRAQEPTVFKLNSTIHQMSLHITAPIGCEETLQRTSTSYHRQLMGLRHNSFERLRIRPCCICSNAWTGS